MNSASAVDRAMTDWHFDFYEIAPLIIRAYNVDLLPSGQPSQSESVNSQRTFGLSTGPVFLGFAIFKPRSCVPLTQRYWNKSLTAFIWFWPGDYTNLESFDTLNTISGLDQQAKYNRLCTILWDCSCSLGDSFSPPFTSDKLCTIGLGVGALLERLKHSNSSCTYLVWFRSTVSISESIIWFARYAPLWQSLSSLQNTS